MTRRTILRIITWIAAGLAFLTFIVLPVVLSWFVTHAGTRPSDRALTSTPAGFGAVYEDVDFFACVDNLPLSGWYLAPKPRMPVIILVHGMFRSRHELLGQARFLYTAGYGLLLLDMRGHGESGNAVSTFGLHEQRDICGAMQFVRYRLGAGYPVVLFGVSMGAVASIFALRHSSGVQALIMDSGFISLSGVAGASLRQFPAILRVPFRWYMPQLLALWAGTTPSHIDVSRFAPALPPCPMLFIIGDRDDKVPVSEIQALAARVPSEQHDVLIILNASHGKSFATAPVVYEQRILDFLSGILSH